MTALEYHNKKRRYWYKEFKQLMRGRHTFKSDTYRDMVVRAKQQYKLHKSLIIELEELHGKINNRETTST